VATSRHACLAALLSCSLLRRRPSQLPSGEPQLPPPLLSPHATCGTRRSGAGPPGRRLVSRVPPLLLAHAAPLLQARAASRRSLLHAAPRPPLPGLLLARLLARAARRPGPAPCASHAHAVRCSPARAARGERRGGRGAEVCRSRRGELGSAGGELSRTPAQRRAAQQGGEARMAASGHVGSDVAVHVGSQCWSEAFWISSDTLE